MTTRPFTLVLSGGGMKGLAHIGVLRALEERGLRPSLVVGTSMGALVAAAWAAGLDPATLSERALLVRRRTLFRVAHVDMALRRMRAPAVYRPEPLRQLIASMLGERAFADLHTRLIVNTVDLHSGAQVLWGLPGLDDMPVAEAVYASCALPGLFPPARIRGRVYADGAVVENLPIRFAAMAGDGPVIAVNLNTGAARRPGVERGGFAATYTRGLELVMQSQFESALRRWSDPPLLLVHPEVETVGMFAFDRTAFLLDEGRRAMLRALDQLPDGLFGLAPGVHPVRTVRITVDRARCIGCGECALWAPRVFRIGADRRAEVMEAVHTWSPVDGSYAQHCPVEAIGVAPFEGREGLNFA